MLRTTLTYSILVCHSDHCDQIRYECAAANSQKRAHCTFLCVARLLDALELESGGLVLRADAKHSRVGWNMMQAAQSDCPNVFPPAEWACEQRSESALLLAMPTGPLVHRQLKL